MNELPPISTFVADAADADLQSLSKEELFRRMEEVMTVGQPIPATNRQHLTAFIDGDAGDFFAVRDKWAAEIGAREAKLAHLPEEQRDAARLQLRIDDARKAAAVGRSILGADPLSSGALDSVQPSESTPNPRGGPRTSEGKAKSSLNNLQHGRTGSFRIVGGVRTNGADARRQSGQQSTTYSGGAADSTPVLCELAETQGELDSVVSAFTEEHQPATATELVRVEKWQSTPGSPAAPSVCRIVAQHTFRSECAIL